MHSIRLLASLIVSFNCVQAAQPQSQPLLKVCDWLAIDSKKLVAAGGACADVEAMRAHIETLEEHINLVNVHQQTLESARAQLVTLEGQVGLGVLGDEQVAVARSAVASAKQSLDSARLAVRSQLLSVLPQDVRAKLDNIQAANAFAIPLEWKTVPMTREELVEAEACFAIEARCQQTGAEVPIETELTLRDLRNRVDVQAAVGRLETQRGAVDACFQGS